MGYVRIAVVNYDHPDAAKLIDQVQRENAARYGTVDETPVEPSSFAAPHGIFLVGYVDDMPVACGGWRVHHLTDSAPAGDAEIKRMYVAETVRRQGLARQMLAELEHTALLAGHRRTILETGTMQPEALALYRAVGYREITKFGHYADAADSVSMAKNLTDSVV